jgi:hypothetical protein
MGSGEDAVFELLSALHHVPEGSLVAVEEVELGIHPEAMRCLAEVMLNLALSRKLQIVVTTHSEAFLDALPRVARCLVRKVGDKHEVFAGPTCRFAMSDMSGEAQREVTVYVEDAVAASLVGTMMSAEQRRRINVVPVGAKPELAKAAYFHQLSGAKTRRMVIWDGDVEDAEIGGWWGAHYQDQADRPAWGRLPGNTAPELMLADRVRTNSDAAQHVAMALGVGVDQVLDAFHRAHSAADHHALFALLASELDAVGGTQAVLNATCRAVVATCQGEFAQVRALVEEQLP